MSTPTITLRVECSACDGLGYNRATGRACEACRSRGAYHLVECPVHGERVARDLLTGAMLGRCSGCAADAAQALSILENTNGRAGAFLAEELARAAKEVTP